MDLYTHFGVGYIYYLITFWGTTHQLPPAHNCGYYHLPFHLLLATGGKCGSRDKGECSKGAQGKDVQGMRAAGGDEGQLEMEAWVGVGGCKNITEFCLCCELVFTRKSIAISPFLHKGMYGVLGFV